MPKSFRDLDVYQLARKLAIEKLDRINKIYKIINTKMYPGSGIWYPEEKGGAGSGIRYPVSDICFHASFN